jgi:hypothetical protein
MTAVACVLGISETEHDDFIQHARSHKLRNGPDCLG